MVINTFPIVYAQLIRLPTENSIMCEITKYMNIITHYFFPTMNKMPNPINLQYIPLLLHVVIIYEVIIKRSFCC